MGTPQSTWTSLETFDSASRYLGLPWKHSG